MSEKRIVVWVQRFKDRDSLMLQWIDPDTGKRKSKSAGTNYMPSAEIKARDLEYELNNNLHKEASRMSWEKFRELFEAEYLPGLRPYTQKNFRRSLVLFEQLCNPTSLRSINERTLSRFVAELRKLKGRGHEGGMLPSTLKVRLQFLHVALQWAVDQKLIPECPKFPSIKVPEKVPQPVPVESFERIYAKAAPDAEMQAYLLAGWLAGLRLAEAFELEWEETDKAPYLDLARNRIILPGEFVKGVADQWLPLDPELRQALEALPSRGRKVFPFIGRNGKRKSVHTIADRVVWLAKKAGVRLSMKSLRRGFGCRYASRVPAQVLQKLMRHSDIKTTMKYYVNVDDAVEEAVLGPQRNSLRNIRPDSSDREDGIVDVNIEGASGND